VQNLRVLIATLCLVFLNLSVAAYFLMRSPDEKHRAIHNPELTEPRWAVAAVRAHALFFTPAAKAELQAHKPELASDADARAFAQAMQNPALFRQLDHTRHFDAVLLCGDPSAYRALLQHLLETRDWVLAYLDHTSVIFQRPPATAWEEQSVAAMKEKFTGKERAIFLTQVAGKLLAVGKTTSAKTCLDEAISLDKNSPETWTQLSVYDGQINRWADALAHVDKALALDRDNAFALTTKAQILFGARRFSEALTFSNQALEQNPQDPGMLFFHAKIAHEAHAFYQEIDALKKLIAMAEKDQQPVSGYYIYLGQAYAADSQAKPAVEQFEKAAAANDLTPKQREFVQECITRIKSRAAL
jgi:tetratricopeptide (TPR) repeat protein